MPHVEALIFASERPITQMELTEMLGQAFELPIEAERIATCIDAIREKYEAQYYPFQLREAGGGYQFLTKKAYHKTVLQLNGDKYIKKLSAAAMETLAIIAYHEPASRAEIEAIRGVQISKGTLDVLMEAGWVRPAGRREAPGRPLTYATTQSFLAHFGLESRRDLPGIDDLKAAGLLDPIDAAMEQLELESDEAEA